jgi:hypothetical protein
MIEEWQKTAVTSIFSQHSYTRSTYFDPFNWLIACKNDDDYDDYDDYFLALYNKVLPSFKYGVLSVLSGANCMQE